MEIIVNRTVFGNNFTLGRLFIDGIRVCDTLEDKYRDLETHDKVYGQTAIPYGRYKVNMNIVSPKFKDRAWAQPYGGIVPTIEDVPHFDRILIHVGNTPEDTNGCLLVGMYEGNGRLSRSTQSYQRLMDKYLMIAKENGEEIWITITK